MNSNNSVIIIDRRLNSKKSPGIRLKALRRIQKTINKQIKQQVADGEIRDLVEKKDAVITVPDKKLKQYSFKYGKTGKKETVIFGNQKFRKGDRLIRPKCSGGNGKGGGSNEGDGENDDFRFILTKEEYREYFFKNCKLPYLEKQKIARSETLKRIRAGYTVDGNPSQLNLSRSIKYAKSRKGGIRGRKKKKIEALEVELTTLLNLNVLNKKQQERIDELHAEILKLKNRIKKIPFIIEKDLRYNQYQEIPVPISQAVVIMLMDTSWSMGEWEKEMAKRFYMMLYMFLEGEYNKIELVFIGHTTVAHEVNEEEFFYGRNTGGTIVSSGLKKIIEVLEHGTKDGRKFPLDSWNVYIAQVSDGDNSSLMEERETVKTLMVDKLLPATQYFAYIEIKDNQFEFDMGLDSELMDVYNSLNHYKHFQMKHITEEIDIYPVFLELFSDKKEAV